MKDKDYRNDKLQELRRGYLSKMKQWANKHGLDKWIDDTIKQNMNGQCVATEQEVELLSRCVDDERVNRTDIPEMLGKSYRYCVDNEIFEQLKTLGRRGIYSKVDAVLFAEKMKREDYGNQG